MKQAMTQEEIDQAIRLKSYMPYRRIFFLVSPDGTERQIHAKLDRRLLNNRLRKGWTGLEVLFNQ